jgi:hypothetical protein
MTTIRNIPSTTAVALVLSGWIANPAALPGQPQDLPHHARRAPALRSSLGSSSVDATPAAGSTRPESGLR